MAPAITGAALENSSPDRLTQEPSSSCWRRWVYLWWMAGTNGGSLAVCALTIAMSWGAYFYGFNAFLLRWLPLYNKFRAPSMILVVPTFLFCMLATLTLDKILRMEDRASLWRQYRRGVMVMGGIFLLLIGMYFLSAIIPVRWETELVKRAGRPRQFGRRDIWTILCGPCAPTASRFLAKA